MGRTILMIGDLVMIYLFAFMGRSSHQESLDLGGTFMTAFPFMLGWLISGFFTHAWRLNDYKKWSVMMKRTLFTWVIGIPLGLIIRYVFFENWNPAFYTFVIVSLVVTLILFLIWRSLFFWLYRLTQ